jgi:hypothetical protein
MGGCGFSAFVGFKMAEWFLGNLCGRFMMVLGSLRDAKKLGQGKENLKTM